MAENMEFTVSYSGNPSTHPAIAVKYQREEDYNFSPPVRPDDRDITLPLDPAQARALARMLPLLAGRPAQELMHMRDMLLHAADHVEGDDHGLSITVEVKDSPATATLVAQLRKDKAVSEEFIKELESHLAVLDSNDQHATGEWELRFFEDNRVQVDWNDGNSSAREEYDPTIGWFEPSVF